MKNLEKNRLIKVGSIVAVAILLTATGVWWATRLNKEDCTKYETYDAVMGDCYFECDTDKQCEEIAKKVDAELNKYFEGSKTVISTSNPEPKPKNVPKQETSDNGTTDKLLTRADTGSETNGTIYTVSSTGELLPKPTARDQQLWNLFVRIATKQTIKQRVASFEVFDDGNNSSAASVWQASNPEKWHMNVNAAFSGERKDLIHTLVHEFGHIVTLNTTQVGGVSGACPNYSVPEGCTKSGSYLAAFYAKYWAKYGNAVPKSSFSETYQPENTPLQPQGEVYGGAQSDQPPVGPYEDPSQMADGAYNYQGDANGGDSSFVSEYAKSHPVEDLAETFAYFILRPKPSDASEASQKIVSLYAYPELVTLRNQIRASLGSEIQ